MPRDSSAGGCLGKTGVGLARGRVTPAHRCRLALPAVAVAEEREAGYRVLPGQPDTPDATPGVDGKAGVARRHRAVDVKRIAA